ncbi:uncharacterized protein LOC136031958 [Artemia franciscana]|uniref:uncharacterized protein LOC136031958 n=1 Tax=Artemia franciscana TaxID=6661 RepID=UPI0032DA5EC2
MRVKICCFGWMSVKTGCYVSAIYSIVYFFKILIMDLTYSFTNDAHFEPTNTDYKTIIEILKGYPLVSVLLDISIILFAVVGLFTSLLLIYGIAQSSAVSLVPWLVVFVISNLLDLIYALYLIVFSLVSMLSAFTVVLFMAELGVITLSFYGVVCVSSHYQTIKKKTVQTAVESDNFDEMGTQTSAKYLNRISEQESSFLTREDQDMLTSIKTVAESDHE